MADSQPSLSHPLLHQPLADIVAADPRTAVVFDRVGLDYCCHGDQTLEDAATRRGLDVSSVLSEIEASGPLDRPAAEWADLDVLTAHIVSHHHGYIRRITPVIAGWLDKLVNRHGQRHPELADVRTTFQKLSAEMATHMAKEEHLLFPFVDALAVASRSGGRLPIGPFGTVFNPIRAMEEEHRHAGQELERLRSLTNGYTPPPDACTTYRLSYAELATFEADMHRHVHLENHVLFPAAIELERRLA